LPPSCKDKVGQKLRETNKCPIALTVYTTYGPLLHETSRECLSFFSESKLSMTPEFRKMSKSFMAV